MPTQKRTFKRCKLVYNEIKRRGQSFSSLFVSAVVAMETKNPFVTGGKSSISASAAIGQLGTREKDTDNYLIKSQLAWDEASNDVENLLFARH